jgi:excisionase family DNA binding protein
MSNVLRNKEWLNASEIARYIGFTDQVVRRAIKAGELECIKFGKSYFAKQEAVDRWIECKKVNTGS